MSLFGSRLQSTASEVDWLYYPVCPGTDQDIIDDHRERARAAVERAKTDGFDVEAVRDHWLKKLNENESDNFTRNCFLCLSMSRLVSGLVCFAIWDYIKTVRESTIQKSEVASQHVGTVGERIKNMSVVITFVSFSEGTYGITTIVKMQDEAGNVLTWFASGTQQLEIGKKIILTGTVKKHDEYRSIKQTVLTRCKIS
jgi:hypothetical protein